MNSYMASMKKKTILEQNATEREEKATNKIK